MPVKASSRKYIENNFPELLRYKITTSRMYEKTDKPHYRDNWWFKFMDTDLQDSEYIIFAGALDYINRDFKIIKVPASHIISNLDSIDVNSKGWINIYLHFTDLIDLRHTANLSFKGFDLN